jgi:hypothetical protein
VRRKKMIDKKTPLFHGGDFTNIQTWEIQSDLTIRQYYAAKAMQSLLEKYDPEKYIPFNDIAMDAFCMANAMIGFENKEDK